MATILAMVNAEKEGQIESKLMKARQLEEIRQARLQEAEARQAEKKNKLVSLDPRPIPPPCQSASLTYWYRNKQRIPSGTRSARVMAMPPPRLRRIRRRQSPRESGNLSRLLEELCKKFFCLYQVYVSRWGSGVCTGLCVRTVISMVTHDDLLHVSNIQLGSSYRPVSKGCQ